jgi:putative transposase
MNDQPCNQLWLQKGASVANNGREYVILAIADINLLLARDRESGEKVLLKIGELGPPLAVEGKKPDTRDEIELLGVPNELWSVAEARRKWIDPLLSSYSSYSEALADQIAADAQVSRATVYRWVAAYRQSGRLSSLLPGTRLRGGKGKTRIAPEVEAMILQTIKDFHDTDQKNTIAATVLEIRRRCSNAGYGLPAPNTIRTRLKRTDGRDRTFRREGEAAAYAKHDMRKGTVPDAEWPLSLVQIDHTLLPVVIVDDKYRKPINRAWITLAIDVYSRMCLGMYLSLDAPSAMSAGMCIANSILPKESWLRRLGMKNVEWPVWGVMGILHMDNAREFRGDMLISACKEFDVDLHLRPVKKPRYGAHIERLMGTVSEGLKSVRGATYSGPDEKGEYDAEGNACMTFSEIERWLILFFARYHISTHQGIGMQPIQKWGQGLLGTKKMPGRGLPARRTDEEFLRINFTPYVDRTVQDYGVQIDSVDYYHDVLRPYMGAIDPKHPKQKRRFRFHRDPRDISQLYFFDEFAKRYCAIPYRDISLPPVSIWELRDAQRQAQKQGIPKEDMKRVFEILNEQRSLEADAAARTKAARFKEQRRLEHAKQQAEKKETMPLVTGSTTPSMPPSVVRGYDPEMVQTLAEEDD